MGQNLRFKAPIRAGDTVHATVTVKELIPEKCRARLTTVCTVDGEIVIDGGCIGNDHVARSPKNLSLRADRAKERLLDPRPEISLRSGGCDLNGGLTICLTIHPHPTLSETIGMAAEAFEGTITDLYIPKKK